MSSPVDVAESQTTTEASGRQLARHELLVDASERHAALVELARQCDDFTVEVEDSQPRLLLPAEHRRLIH
jgi:hypothetical protein